jgi:hypothetical protein
LNFIRIHRDFGIRRKTVQFSEGLHFRSANTTTKLRRLYPVEDKGENSFIAEDIWCPLWIAKGLDENAELSIAAARKIFAPAAGAIY